MIHAIRRRSLPVAAEGLLAILFFLCPGPLKAQEPAQADPMVEGGAMDMEQWKAAQRRQVQKLLQDPQWAVTHEQTRVIKPGGKAGRLAVNNFCLDRAGNLLVCCGGSRVEYSQKPGAQEPEMKVIEEPAEIRTISQDGNLLATWKLDSKPEAICVHTDGSVFVGGAGKIIRLDASGNVLASAPSPAVAPAAPAAPPPVARVPRTRSKPLIQILGEGLLRIPLGGPPGEDPAQAAAMARAMEERKREVTGIAVSARDLFVACPEAEGYGYCVWRMSHDLKSPVRIVEGLRGCCSQMDIQSKNGEVWVAENARHRVVRYDRDGKVLASFGKADREKADCFGGCCEPKNLRFGPAGELYASESGPPVVVKRFSLDGKFLGVVGVADFYTGCVRVTVAVSADARRVFILNSDEAAIHVLQDRRDRPTHEETTTIAVPLGDRPVEIHSFCVAGDGNLLAACGGERIEYSQGPNGLEVKTITEPSGIRVIGPTGNLLATWSLEMTPQAINLGPDETILLGGQGRIARLDREGKVLRVVDAPHVKDLPPPPPIPETNDTGETEAEREAKKARIEDLQKKIVPLQEALSKTYLKMQETKDDKDAGPAAKAAFEKSMDEYREVDQELQTLTTGPREIALQKKAELLWKKAVTGIAATGSDVFVACPSTEGYGYDVWRLDGDLGQGVKIVKGLAGCCGQMDIQAREGKLYVAENARHRVLTFDREGKQLNAWGKGEREGEEGFGSCCNPMNLRFGPDGMLYTSEASIGRIKRYSADGEFLGVVGTAKIVSGCKHVALGMSKDGARVYLLDISRNQIVVMERRAAGENRLIKAKGNVRRV